MNEYELKLAALETSLEEIKNKRNEIFETVLVEKGMTDLTEEAKEDLMWENDEIRKEVKIKFEEFKDKLKKDFEETIAMQQQKMQDTEKKLESAKEFEAQMQTVLADTINRVNRIIPGMNITNFDEAMDLMQDKIHEITEKMENTTDEYQLKNLEWQKKFLENNMADFDIFYTDYQAEIGKLQDLIKQLSEQKNKFNEITNKTKEKFKAKNIDVSDIDVEKNTAFEEAIENHENHNNIEAEEQTIEEEIESDVEETKVQEGIDEEKGVQGESDSIVLPPKGEQIKNAQKSVQSSNETKAVIKDAEEQASPAVSKQGTPAQVSNNSTISSVAVPAENPITEQPEQPDPILEQTITETKSYSGQNLPISSEENNYGWPEYKKAKGIFGIFENMKNKSLIKKEGQQIAVEAATVVYDAFHNPDKVDVAKLESALITLENAPKEMEGVTFKVKTMDSDEPGRPYLKSERVKPSTGEKIYPRMLSSVLEQASGEKKIANLKDKIAGDPAKASLHDRMVMSLLDRAAKYTCDDKNTEKYVETESFKNLKAEYIKTIMPVQDPLTVGVKTESERIQSAMSSRNDPEEMAKNLSSLKKEDEELLP